MQLLAPLSPPLRLRSTLQHIVGPAGHADRRIFLELLAAVVAETVRAPGETHIVEVDAGDIVPTYQLQHRLPLERSVLRVGGAEPVYLDFRVIPTPLAAAVALEPAGAIEFI